MRVMVAKFQKTKNNAENACSGSRWRIILRPLEHMLLKYKVTRANATCAPNASASIWGRSQPDKKQIAFWYLLHLVCYHEDRRVRII